MAATTALLLLFLSSTQALLLSFFTMLIVFSTWAIQSILPIIWSKYQDHVTFPPDSPSQLLPGHVEEVKTSYHRRRVRRHTRRGAAPAEEQQVVECCFCLCEVEEGDEVRELRCNHLFHRPCLDRWVDQYDQPNCPLCRQWLVAPPPPEPFMGSTSC